MDYIRLENLFQNLTCTDHSVNECGVNNHFDNYAWTLKNILMVGKT